MKTDYYVMEPSAAVVAMLDKKVKDDLTLCERKRSKLEKEYVSLMAENIELSNMIDSLIDTLEKSTRTVEELTNSHEAVSYTTSSPGYSTDYCSTYKDNGVGGIPFASILSNLNLPKFEGASIKHNPGRGFSVGIQFK